MLFIQLAFKKNFVKFELCTGPYINDVKTDIYFINK
jgi:hypothetical protein